MNRQEYQLKQGITKEGIENHLRWERKKSEESRERRKKNNEKNKELIKEIKRDLVGNTFKLGERTIKVISISPTVDGTGFWYKSEINFSDGSSGIFRYFYRFDEYSKKQFIKWLKIS